MDLPPTTTRLVKLLRPSALARYLQHYRLTRTEAGKPPACLLGLDVGGSKIGVSITDPTLTLARPLLRIDRRPPPHGKRDFPAFCGKELVKLIEKHQVAGLVVGYPLTLWDGRPGARCAEVLRFMEQVYRDAPRELPVPFALWDERMTTQEARAALQEGMKGGKKKGRQQALEDQVAATLILQSFLNGHVTPTIVR